MPLVLAAGAGWIWSRAGGQATWGWATAASLSFLTLADAMLFLSLPTYKLSFGPAHPPILGLALARCFLALLAAASAGARPALAWGVGFTVQLCLWALMAYGTLVEPFRLQLTRLALPSPKLENPGFPLRIVHLSDLHVERLTRREQSLPSLVAGLVPDLIVITGDFLNTSYNDDGRALADLRWLLAQLYAPAGVYAVWGTQRVDLPDVLRPVLEETGVRVLDDQALPLEVAGQHLWLLGLNCSRDLAADAEKLEQLVATVPRQDFRLLLYHTPDLMPQAAAAAVDLYLAGHTHGGQWRIPGLGAVLTSSSFWKRYEAGHYQEGDTHLYVSRGLGMEGFGVPRARFFCPPEIASFTLYGQAGPAAAVQAGA